ncbi:mRNA-binding protein PUF2 [Plasmodium brasilianum]|uniref:mRNA-binding protein PUF2, putative n=2 Tax=Plasmodium (Plasmodium) TaxID=418103 RepID=A0A1A8VW38_PLAMA|nr:mRNA-binding protein PUF2, putative [Plasmodium malariae]KAI4840121.1 mRNA-binding protein PUF2 [Plasmodium brasilianum]SBS83047.1 mRNA-binding protein PUF2, putative (PUF2) [Plasmodium malariae]SBT87484.1 mRNA-binding protein PUF2, putative [Plasmodium malariae]
MKTIFFDETYISDLKNMQPNFEFKEEYDKPIKLNSCSTFYDAIPSSNEEILYFNKTLTEEQISLLNEEEVYSMRNEKCLENFPNLKNGKKFPEQVIKKISSEGDGKGQKGKAEEEGAQKGTAKKSENICTILCTDVRDAVCTGIGGKREREEHEDKREIDLNKVMDDIFFLCFHKNGCEYIIRKLKENDTEEKQIILNSLLIDARSLCPDVYGSYVAQSIYDLNDEKYKERFTDEFLKHTSFLALHTYGCRLIQKSLESLSDEYKCKIFKELQDDLIAYICHQNGNHVIQKCIEVLPSKNIDMIINIIEEYLPFLSSHAYGCRIVQRIYEIGNIQQIKRLNEKIIKKIHLIKNRYGNYVIQKCFEYSDDTARFIITDEIVNDIYKLSSHKYACNIIEKILLKKEYRYKKKIIKKIVNDISEGNENIINICKDCYGNFMMQKLLTTCRRKERNLIVKTIIENLDKLKDETYGKYILRAINNLET